MTGFGELSVDEPSVEGAGSMIVGAAPQVLDASTTLSGVTIDAPSGFQSAVHVMAHAKAWAGAIADYHSAYHAVGQATVTASSTYDGADSDAAGSFPV